MKDIRVRSPRGSVLLLVVVLLAVVMVLSMAAIGFSGSERGAASSFRSSEELVACADAGRQYLLSRFRLIGSSPTQLTPTDQRLDLAGLPGCDGGVPSDDSRCIRSGHLGEEVYERLRAGAEESVALPGTRAGLKREVHLLQDQIAMYNRQMKELQDGMAEVMLQIPEATCLMSIPGVAPVSAAVFLGSLGDVHAYRSSRQVLKLAGLSLVQDSSGIRHATTGCRRAAGHCCGAWRSCSDFGRSGQMDCTGASTRPCCCGTAAGRCRPQWRWAGRCSA